MSNVLPVNLLPYRQHIVRKQNEIVLGMALQASHYDLETYTVFTHQQIPLLLAKSALCIQQLKLLFLQHLAIPRSPQSDHTASVRTLVHCETQTSSHPQNLAFYLLGLQGPQQTPSSPRF
jgi:hypothetical protein